jgi:teichuronic acid biosynthesis glycosyltransferase TuaC
MNLLFLSSLFPNSLEPNRSVYSLQIVRELAHLADLMVVAPIPSLGILQCLDAFKKYSTIQQIPAFEEMDGLPVYHPKYFAVPKMGFLHSSTLHAALEPLIRKIHSEWKIDAINCHWLFPDGVTAQRICSSLGIPLMLTPLGCDLNKYLDFKFRKNAIRQALLGADRVSLLNKHMLEICSSLGVVPSRMTIIPNGVDTDKFTISDRSLCRNELGLHEQGKIILFVGTLDPVKGIDSLIRAFAAINRETVLKARLVIAGSGYLDKELKGLVESLGISNSVTFLGAVKHEKLPVWMNAADCLCLPSLREGHPNVMMEALACGIPVVASAVGSIPEFIDSTSGYTTDLSNDDDLYSKLILCLKTDYAREVIRNRVANYTWKSCALRYLEEIKKIVHVKPYVCDGVPCRQDMECAE